MRMLRLAALLVPLLAGTAQAGETVYDVAKGGLALKQVKAETATYQGRPALAVSDATINGAGGDAGRLAVIPGSAFHDGVIEVELSGEVQPNATIEGARGFVGVAFRVDPAAERFEAFYLRPTNGRAEDQVRRNHALQYIAAPDYPWQRLRKEEPEKYESYADLQPATWTKVRIEVAGTKARLYVNGAEQPSLIVNDLKNGDTSGAIALWIGPGTLAHFGKVKIDAR